MEVNELLSKMLERAAHERVNMHRTHDRRLADVNDGFQRGLAWVAEELGVDDFDERVHALYMVMRKDLERRAR